MRSFCPPKARIEFGHDWSEMLNDVKDSKLEKTRKKVLADSFPWNRATKTSKYATMQMDFSWEINA